MGPMMSKASVEASTASGVKTMGTAAGKVRESNSAPVALIATPMAFTVTIWISAARLTVALAAPMALSIPICATFCRVWI